jgi:hypothetical protein
VSSREHAKIRAEAEAKMEVLKQIVPQVASGPRILSEGAPDSGDIDAWMLTRMNSDIFLGLVGLETIAEADDAQYIKDFVDVFLRGLKGIEGFSVKQLERIAIGMSSSAGQRIVKRPGMIGRNITNRAWKEKAESEGAEVEY